MHRSNRDTPRSAPRSLCPPRANSLTWLRRRRRNGVPSSKRLASRPNDRPNDFLTFLSRRARSAAQRSQLGSYHAQIILELLEPGFILRVERLNLAVERLQLPLGRGQLRRVLIAEHPHLIDKHPNPLLDLGNIGGERCRTALLAPVDLVEAGDQDEDASHREHDRKPQS